MKQLRTTLISTVLISWLGGALAVGCGDDDGDATTSSGGKNGGQSGGATFGGANNKGGGSNSGGSNTGGASGGHSGGAAGGDGAGGDPSSGGTAGQGGSAGHAGEGELGGAGGGGGAPNFAPINELSSKVYASASDLRGLSFSKSGSKLYASGHVGADPALEDRKLVVARFSADGTPDASFGKGGFVALNLVPRVLEIVADPDPGAAGAGGLGGAGSEGGAGTAGGAGGAGGGTHEVVVNDGNEQSFGIVELASGELIVQANVRDSAGKGQDVVLIKLDEDGALVGSFGTDGVQRIDFGWTPSDAWAGATGPNDESWGISLDASGSEEKVVLFGYGPAKAGAMTGNPAVQRTDNDRYIARVLASSGELDPQFNGGNVFTLNTGGTFADGGRRGIVEPDGSIVSAGYTNYGDGLGNHIVVIKLEPNGTPDTSFGFGTSLPGVARANPFLDDGGVAECYGIAHQSSGRYVTTGYGRATVANGSSKYGYAPTDLVDLVSFGIQGKALDTTFGRQGTLAIQSEEANLGNTEDRGRDVLALPDDRLVFVGRFGPNPTIFVTLPDGELDTGVGDDGKFAYPASAATGSHFYRVAQSPDGTRIAATTSNDADGARLVVLKVGN